MLIKKIKENKWWEIKGNIGHYLHVLLLHSNTCVVPLLFFVFFSSLSSSTCFIHFQILSPDINSRFPPTMEMFNLFLFLSHSVFFTNCWLYNVHFSWQSLDTPQDRNFLVMPLHLNYRFSVFYHLSVLCCLPF